MDKKLQNAIRNAIQRPVMQRMKVEEPKVIEKKEKRVSKKLEKKPLDTFIPIELTTIVTKEEEIVAWDKKLTVTYTTTKVLQDAKE